MKFYVLFCFVGDSFSLCFGVPASVCCRSSGYMKTRPRLGGYAFWVNVHPFLVWRFTLRMWHKYHTFYGWIDAISV